MTCYRTLPPGETLDFMLAGHEFGIPHAPGYPLLTIIGTFSSVFPGWLFGMEYTFQMNMVLCIYSNTLRIKAFIVLINFFQIILKTSKFEAPGLANMKIGPQGLG